MGHPRLVKYPISLNSFICSMISSILYCLLAEDLLQFGLIRPISDCIRSPVSSIINTGIPVSLRMCTAHQSLLWPCVISYLVPLATTIIGYSNPKLSGFCSRCLIIRGPKSDLLYDTSTSLNLGLLVLKEFTSTTLYCKIFLLAPSAHRHFTWSSSSLGLRCPFFKAC